MRVLHLITHLEPGGIEQWLLDMVGRISRTRCAMDICCKGGSEGRLADAARELDAHVFHCPLRPSHVGFVRELRRHLTEGSYDIAHIHLGAYSGLAVWIAKRAGVPTVTTFHSTRFLPQTWTRLPGIRQLRSVYTRASVAYALAHSDLVTGTSRAILSSVDAKNTARNRSRVLPLGVDLPDGATPEDRAALRESLGWPLDAPVLAAVGSLREAKNPLGVVEIFEKVVEVRPDARLLMVGDGVLRPDVERAIRQRGLTGRAVCTGIRHDVLELLTRCDMLVMPSQYEGFGLAALEASAAGLPVVCSRVGGLVEAVVDGETGFLHPANDLSAMARSIVGLIETPELSQRLGAAGRERVRTEFTPAASANELLDIYDDCLRRHNAIRRNA